MTQLLIMATTGERVEFGRMVEAQVGPHAGTWWRLDALSHNGREHVVRVTRLVHGGRIRRVAAFPLHVFGLAVSEVVALWKRACRCAVHKSGDYVFAGITALVPLAFFEQYHGAERITEIIRMFTG